jgi:NADP-dependent 3-hydroxy acid dehydrogenase YdfG
MPDRPATAVVTGAAMGMGKEISRRLLADGTPVAGLDRNAPALEQARAELGERFEPVVGDVGDWDAHQRAGTPPSGSARCATG